MRERRSLGELGREYRRAAYQRRLSWARGEGLSAHEGFCGLSAELGPNPALAALTGALEIRVEALALDVDEPVADAA